MFNMMGMPGMGMPGQMRPGMPMANAAPPPIQMRPPMGGGGMPPPMLQQPQQQGQGGAAGGMGGMPQIMQLLAAMKGGQSGVPGAQLGQALPGGGGQDFAKIQNMPEWVGGIFGNMKPDGAGMPPINPQGGGIMDSLGAAPMGFGAPGMPQGMPPGIPPSPMGEMGMPQMPGMPPMLPWWLGGAG